MDLKSIAYEAYKAGNSSAQMPEDCWDTIDSEFEEWYMQKEVSDHAILAARNSKKQDASQEENALLAVVMPRELTAGNGSKDLLRGEFKEAFELNEELYHVVISWDTIKNIYKKIVAHHGG